MRLIVSPTVLFALALVPVWAHAQDAVPGLKLPDQVRTAPAAIAELKAETAGKVVEWVVLTPGLSVRPVDGGKVLLFSGPAGRYELLAYTAAGDVPSKPARVVVVIGAPGPDPLPPDPPKPDALTEKVKRAYAEDVEGDPVKRARQAKALAALYRELAKEAADSPAADEFRRIAKETAKSMIGESALTGVRSVVGSELALLLPTDAPFTADQRAGVTRLFDKLAVILEGVTP